ncbi:MAG TPA: methyltransferase, partial [Nocardioides sp.]|nr:methyltransferase [Nocardioides sp.]
PDERFPLVLADPPYVPTDEVTSHPDDPVAAIDGGPDGLDVARTCLAVAAAHLADDGLVVLQLGSAEQSELARPVAAEAGLEVVEVCDVPGGGALVLLANRR